MSDDVTPSGYNDEQRYFHEKDLELLKKKRAELDDKRAVQQKVEAAHGHWMKCPKCGKNMIEIEMDEILVDKCESCQGIYFDAGELELLLMARKDTGVISSLKNLFS